jgi:hypothetical protein
MMEGSFGAKGSSRTMMLRLMSRKAKTPMLSALENQRVPGLLWQDTILIQADRVHTVQLSLSREDKEYLFQCGYDQAQRYFHEAPAHGGAPAAS